MSWFQDSSAESEAQKPHNVLVIAVDGDFPSGHLRFSTWLAPLTINGQTFTAVASLGSVPAVAENMQLVADTRVYQLSAVDPAVIPESEIDNCFGRSWTEYLVWIDTSNHQVLGYELNFEGRMDKIQRKDGASPVIEVSVEHRLVILDSADGWCYTDTHQQQLQPGDTGLNQVASNGSVEITWGGGKANYPGPAYSNITGPGGGGFRNIGAGQR